ncbi:hypothetical protein ISF_07627 [Cordyceps fumosorosea ARSEF 2679]|uniref:Uncharacterized protein n=1 Tax=Cordyceps fumosorosea (strain ARSEF 2679) TaxID=1081104 RepID=A0A167NWP9_CORFA|nr:hypothetical protein ISF_07627 [Cordyceps fumosorosea ARSEF 2679]OAA56029.1 hypothetical protein ISF_07627 [Cordyceps fumosorosea ARSEF 2679]
MHRWRPLHRRHFQSAFIRRLFSTSTTAESIDVRCGSSGHVTVDLYNFTNLRRDEPVLIHLPPLPARGDGPLKLPEFLHGLPVASIRYRWDGLSGRPPLALLDDHKPSPAQWPTPVHDVSFAYSWLSDTFSPEKCGRRGVYVYGSFLGASLAASLALTEAHPHARFAVRGLMAYNGIYNWTMFLPDHRVNRPTTRAGKSIMPPQPRQGSHLHFLQEQMPGLFGKPAHLFDAFASPSLLFHSPGLLVPRSFTMTVAEAVAIDAMVGQAADPALVKTPRKSHLVFPPRKSTLKIPEALLMHDSNPMPLTASGRPWKRKPKAGGNNFQSQAAELVELMRRSVDVVELKERGKWDDNVEGLADEASRRVQMLDTGEDMFSNTAGRKKTPKNHSVL